MLAPAKLAGMTATRQDRPPGTYGLQQRGIHGFPARAVETEPLHSNRMAILQATKAHLKCLATRHGCQLASNKLGIVAGLLETHTQVLTGSSMHRTRHFGIRPEFLCNSKILWHRLQLRLARALA